MINLFTEIQSWNCFELILQPSDWKWRRESESRLSRQTDELLFINSPETIASKTNWMRLRAETVARHVRELIVRLESLSSGKAFKRNSWRYEKEEKWMKFKWSSKQDENRDPLPDSNAKFCFVSLCLGRKIQQKILTRSQYARKLVQERVKFWKQREIPGSLIFFVTYLCRYKYIQIKNT